MEESECKPKRIRKNRKNDYLAERKRNKRKKEKLIDFLSDKCCTDCGITDSRLLEFDHIDPQTKTKAVARLLSSGYGWERLLAEINKCEIVCANCHRIRTYSRMTCYRNQAS
jgi:hypothetical protein